MTAQLLAAGAVYAHAAAFSHRGRGVLATGHKGASKTTTLLTCLRLLGGDYVTNARLLSGSVVVADVRPRLMLWPYLSSGGNGAAPAAVSADEAHDVLLATRLFMFDPASGASAHVNHWLIGTPPATQTAGNLRQVVEDLAATVPC